MALRGRKQNEEVQGFFQRHSNVYLYIPNLIGVHQPLWPLIGVCPAPPSHIVCSISSLMAMFVAVGYVRIIAAAYAYAVALTHPTHCLLAYLFSFVCDELDGRFARMFNQTSTLGSVLDMVTDRSACGGMGA
jgi:CDP-diacylglycerol--inositol 3-phosphatidyltransferase